MDVIYGDYQENFCHQEKIELKGIIEFGRIIQSAFPSITRLSPAGAQIFFYEGIVACIFRQVHHDGYHRVLHFPSWQQP